MPTVLSMCHGGICRAPTREAIDFAHGRASSYVTSDIGAMPSARWHDSHFSWKIGATSFVNVTGVAGSAATATPENVRVALSTAALEPSQLVNLRMSSAPFETGRLQVFWRQRDPTQSVRCRWRLGKYPIVTI